MGNSCHCKPGAVEEHFSAETLEKEQLLATFKTHSSDFDITWACAFGDASLQSYEVGTYVVLCDKLSVWKNPNKCKTCIYILYKGEKLTVPVVQGNWGMMEYGWVLLDETRVKPVNWSLDEIVKRKQLENRKKFRGQKNMYIDNTDFDEVGSCGTHVLHYENGSFQPTEKLLKLSFTNKTLSLGMKRFNCVDINLISWGRHTDTLSIIDSDCFIDDNFFSIIFDNFILNLACRDKAIVEIWVMGLRNFIDCFIRPLNLKEKALGDLRTMKKKNCFGKNNHQKFQELRVLKDARSDSMTSNSIFYYDVEDSSAASSSSFSSKSISSTDSLTLPILFFSQTTRMRYSKFQIW